MPASEALSALSRYESNSRITEGGLNGGHLSASHIGNRNEGHELMDLVPAPCR